MSSHRDHFDLDASDYDAPDAGDQADFFADRDESERGNHYPGTFTDAEMDAWTPKS